MIEARVLGIRTDSYGETAHYVNIASVEYLNGAPDTLTIIDSDTTSFHEDTAAWALGASTSIPTITYTVTGAAGSTITWHGTFIVSKVGS
jgi:hypothetical protein